MAVAQVGPVEAAPVVAEAVAVAEWAALAAVEEVVAVVEAGEAAPAQPVPVTNTRSTSACSR